VHFPPFEEDAHLLNQTHPDTIPTIKALWDEFLPWIASSEVSIGADEYEPSLADAYIDFVNELASYIHAKSGKTVRVWGTAEPSLTKKISRNVTIQHWDFPDASIPVRLMAQGYDVINSEQAFLYLDGKTSDDGQFPQSIDESLIWAGAPGRRGWAPNVFSATDASNNTEHTNPRLRGALFALWNDWGNNATTPLEVYYQLARSVPLVAERAWAGAGVRASELARAQFDAAYPALNSAAPGQNLNRVVKPAHGGVVFEYDLTHRAPGAVVQTGFPSVGPPYTLSFEVMDDPAHPGSAVLFSGSDTSLLAGNLTFVSYGQQYSLPIHLPTTRFASVEIHATREATYALVDGRRLWWTTEMDIWGEYMARGNMSFAAPAATIGQASSGVRFGKVSLTLGA
jgi:hexosaminidase